MLHLYKLFGRVGGEANLSEALMVSGGDVDNNLGVPSSRSGCLSDHDEDEESLSQPSGNGIAGRRRARTETATD